MGLLHANTTLLYKGLEILDFGVCECVVFPGSHLPCVGGLFYVLE